MHRLVIGKSFDKSVEDFLRYHDEAEEKDTTDDITEILKVMGATRKF
jgi:hypothetical protein